jgi:hypothetical protein
LQLPLPGGYGLEPVGDLPSLVLQLGDDRIVVDVHWGLSRCDSAA